MSDDLGEKIRQMIVERCFLNISPDQIDDEASLMQELGLDSVQILEVVVGLEDVLGVRVDDADFDMDNFSSVAAIRNFVRKKMAGQDRT